MKPPYSITEIAFLKESYQLLGNVEIGKRLNRSPASIRKKRYALKLFRTPEQLKKIWQRNPNLFKKRKLDKFINKDISSFLMFGNLS